MQRIRFVITLAAWLVTVTLLEYAVAAGKGEPAEIVEVRKTFKFCQELTRHADAKRLELFQVAKNATEVGRWQRSVPVGGDEMSHSTMTIFASNNRIYVADLYNETTSGDWWHTTNYCYRSDGTLAFVLSLLRTFHGNVSVEDRLYFNRAGKNIRSLRNVFDLITNKPVNIEERGFMERKPHIFPSTQAIIDEVGRGNVLPLFH